MELTVTVAGEHVADELRSLRMWLVREDELRGRVRLLERPPDPGTLGPVAEAVAVALGPGGAATVLASVLIAWLRQRTGDLTIKATREGERTAVEISAKRVRSLDAAGIQQQIVELRSLLDEGRRWEDGGTPPIQQ